MKFGVCYYPEHWPESRWAEDARLMVEAGLDIVRLAEFAWSEMEPEEGHYEWGWLDRAIEILAGEGLDIVLGTPTATPPIWLSRAKPSILRVDPTGRRRDHGSRRHVCPNSPIYHQYSDQIVSQMVERYGHHPAVIGWQIDNEWGGGRSARCYCPACRTAFQSWLKRRYGSIERLNEAWGTVFWSQTYQHWEQIGQPDESIDKPNPSHQLDYYRFASDSYLAYQQRQVDIIREKAPDHFVTTNFMGLFPDLDQFDLAGPLDFATWDSYPTGNLDRLRKSLYPVRQDGGQNDPVYAFDVGDPLITGMAHALTWALRERPFWIMEQQCGHINWGDTNPAIRSGTTRLWCWHALAEGANAIIFFRWRATRFAQEQYHSGLLDHAGQTAVGYEDLLTLRDEQERLAEIATEPVTASVAILFNFDDLWALELQPHQRDFRYLAHLFLYYQSLHRLGIPVNFVCPESDLSRYKLLIAPTAHIVDDELAARLSAFVHSGGRLLLGVRSGFKTPSNLVVEEPLPGQLHGLAGLTVSRWESWPAQRRVGLRSQIPQLQGPVSYWVEQLQPEGRTEVLVRYAAPLDDVAAFTYHPLGQGGVYYLGWYPTVSQTNALLSYLSRELGLQKLATLPPGLVLGQRGRYLLLHNFTDERLTAVVQQKTIAVPPRDVAVLERTF